jgi:hypothetical protein
MGNKIGERVMINTTLCLECGTDTAVNGYVNRVPASKTNIDGYICGTCDSRYDECLEYYVSASPEKASEVLNGLMSIVQDNEDDLNNISISFLMEYINSGRFAVIAKAWEGDDDPRFDEDGEEVDNFDDIMSETNDEQMEMMETSWFAEIDLMFPQAPVFRELMNDEEDWTTEDKQGVEELITHYELTRRT